MKTTINNLKRLTAFRHDQTREEIPYFNTAPFFLSLKLSLTKTLAVVALLFLLGYNATAQPVLCTYVKEVYGVGMLEPRIFKDPSSADYYLTARTNDSTFISKLDAAGNFIWTQAILFPNDFGTITDMIVDQVDGTLSGVIRGVTNNIMFKYNYTAASFDWIQLYPNNYIFQNIHQVSATTYVVTGEVLGGRMTIFEVDRVTGQMFGYGYQNESVTGEFFSAFDGTDIYGACRYYTTASTIFNPSLFRHDVTTGANLWTKTYVRNAATCRIYPVAPIIDGGDLLQLSSGADAAFNTYQTGPTKVWLLKTDLAGTLAWTNQINIPGYTRLNVKKIINTATGYYLLIDSYNGSIVDFFFVVKTDKNGKVQWANRYGITGLNTVISGVEDAGFLYLTALSGSYTPGSNPLLLKLDANGMSDINCSYIKKVNANEIPYTNTTVNKPPVTNPTGWAETAGTDKQIRKKSAEKIFCSTQCPGVLPCQTLTGSLATGVLAFYPFGYGSLLDLGGGGYDLTNPFPSTASPTVDRGGSNNCAYRFIKANGDFLTRTASTFLNGLTTAPFSISLWYQPIGTRPVGDYELMIGRGTTTTGLHCPDTWGQWSVGLYDCRRAMVGFDMNSHWEGTAGYPNCAAQLAGVSNSWHHFAFVYNGSGGYDIYVDGVLSSNIHGPCGFMSGNIDPLMLGVDYTGDLDDIVIYNRAITPAEVMALMALPESCCDGVTSSNKTGNNTTPNEIKKINLTEEVSGIKIYPNPTGGLVSISADAATIRSVAVYSNTGALVQTFDFNAANVSVNLEPMAAGIYFLKVVTDSGSSLQKVIKN